jgi:hypothetical protein
VFFRGTARNSRKILQLLRLRRALSRLASKSRALGRAGEQPTVIAESRHSSTSAAVANLRYFSYLGKV